MSEGTLANSSDPAVDFEVLLRLKEQTWDGEEDLVPELIEAFLDEVPESCVALQQLVSDGDATEVRKKAHYLRSSTSNLGATRMTKICAGLEQMAREGSLNGAEQVVEQLNQEVVQVRVGFEKYLAEHTA